MKKLLFIILALSPQIALADWPPMCPTSNCVERLVTIDNDDFDGSLRDVIKHACQDAGDDAIQFGFSTTISLKSPIVIPASCNGKIFIFGRAGGRNAIDGRSVPMQVSDTQNCLIRVGSSGNTFSRLNIVNYANPNRDERVAKPAVGICFVGDGNTVTDSTFGVIDAGNAAQSNDVGVFVGSNQNTITNNHFSQNKLDGIQIAGNENRILGNYLGIPLESCDFQTEQEKLIQGSEGKSSSGLTAEPSNSFSPGVAPIPSAEATPIGGCQLIIPKENKSASCPMVSNWQFGIHLFGDAHNNVVGSLNPTERNTIQYQGKSGIRLSGSSNSIHNLLSPNIFNLNKELGIDLGLEGVTEDDFGDGDEGPNTLLNSPELSLVQVRNRYSKPTDWRIVLYGKGQGETFVDLYIADSQEADGGSEGLSFLQRISIPSGEEVFSVELKDPVTMGTPLVAVAVDPSQNTSEFSYMLIVELDSDMDGIPDRIEDANRNGIVDPGESDPFDADTDHDGLPDGIEDANHNGKRDENETAAYLADTDGDGLSDFVETHGDGRYDPQKGDTNPLLPDTDCDGLLDGEEDTNHNGIIELSLGETFPQITDSDGDDVSDGPLENCLKEASMDNCSIIPNPDQTDTDRDGTGDTCDWN